MKKIFLLLTLVLFALACTKETKKPKNVLSKETMVKIMADMTLAEAKLKNLRLASDTSRKIYQEYEKSIFEKMNVSAEQYQESYQYYLLNFNEMSAMHAAVIDTLDRRHKKATRE